MLRFTRDHLLNGKFSSKSITYYEHNWKYFNRSNLPASLDLDGSIYWLSERGYSRSDGPAITYISSESEYWYMGKKISRFELWIIEK